MVLLSLERGCAPLLCKFGDRGPPEWVAEAPPAQRTELLVLTANELAGRLSLDGQAWFTLGRNSAVVDIPLLDLSVSRRHAVLAHHRCGGLVVVDLGSAHGTFVWDQRIPPFEPVPLKPGCLLRFGASPQAFLFKAEDAPAHAPAAAQLPSPAFGWSAEDAALFAGEGDDLLRQNTLLNENEAYQVLPAAPPAALPPPRKRKLSLGPRDEEGARACPGGSSLAPAPPAGGNGNGNGDDVKPGAAAGPPRRVRFAVNVDAAADEAPGAAPRLRSPQLSPRPPRVAAFSSSPSSSSSSSSSCAAAAADDAPVDVPAPMEEL